MPTWLSRELADRIGVERVILLPPLNPAEGSEFIGDVIQHFRDKSDSQVDSCFPFTTDAVSVIVEQVREKAGKKGLRPRKILQAFNAVLEEAETKIEDGTLSIINGSYARDILSERAFLETEDPE